MSSKRRFRIESGQYGGELTIGTIDSDFVDYFIDKDESVLINTIHSYDWNDDSGDTDAPKMYCSWTELDDFEHLNGAYSDGGFIAVEVPSDGSDDYADNENAVEFEGFHLFDRECIYVPKIINDDNYIPILAFHNAEKGSFAYWFVETEGEDFDPNKFAFATCDTNIAEIVDTVWYNKKELEASYDHAWSKGERSYASVGYLSVDEHVPMAQIDTERMWEDFDEFSE